VRKSPITDSGLRVKEATFATAFLAALRASKNGAVREDW
jgi:hypothetical protein